MTEFSPAPDPLVPIPPRSSGRITALIIAAALVLGGAVVAIALSVGGGDDSTPSQAHPTEPTPPVESARDELPDKAPDLATANARGDLNVVVVAQQWSWTFNYTKGGSTLAQPVWETGTEAETPTLWLVKGKSVTFDLYSPDVIHSFWPTDFLFKMDVVPGRAAQNYFTLTPGKEGIFLGRCAELCGTGHSRMLFNVKVVNQQEFDRHLEELQTAGQTGINAPEGYADEIATN